MLYGVEESIRFLKEWLRNKGKNKNKKSRKKK